MIKELTEIRDAMLKGVEEKDLLYIKMQINKIDTLLYNASENNGALPGVSNPVKINTVCFMCNDLITEIHRINTSIKFSKGERVSFNDTYYLIEQVHYNLDTNFVNVWVNIDS